MAIPRLNPSGDRPTFENRVDSQGRPISSNVPVTKAELAQFWNAEENIRNGNKEKSSNKQTRVTTTSNRMSMALTNKLNTMIRQLDGINQNTERMMNILAYQNKAKKKSLDDEEKEDIEKNKKDSEVRQKRTGFGAFGSFFRALAGWGKIVETLLLPVIMGIISALVKAKKYLGAIGVAMGSLLMSRGIRRALGHGLSALGKAIRSKFSGSSKTTKEEVEKEAEPTGKASKAEEAEKNIGKEAEKYTEHTNKNGQKVFRDSKGKFVKKEIAEAAKEAEKAGTFMGKFSKAFGVVSKIFKVVGRFFVLVDVINTVIGTIHGAISGYQKGGVLGALEGGARGFLNSFIGWIWDLGTWAIGSLFKLFGADKIGDSIKKFNFDKLLDKMVDWVGEGIDAIGKGVHAAVQAMKNSIASLLDHLPGPIKKLIPGSVWSALGRMPDGSKQPDLDKQAQMAYAQGGEQLLSRVQASGKNYELNMNAQQQQQFNAGIAMAKSGVLAPDTNSMAQALMQANPGLNKKDAMEYIKSAVLPQAKAMSGQQNVGIGTTAALVKTGAKIGNIDTDKLWAQMSPEIAEGESKRGGYDARAGAPGGVQAYLSNRTIDQIIHSTGAAGKYQILPSTLKEIYAKVGLKLTDKFSPENQEKLGRFLFDRRVKAGAKDGVAGIQLQLAKEWASLPKDSSGIGAYDGYNGNKAFGGAGRGSLLASQIQGSIKGPNMPPVNGIASTTGKGGNNTLVNAPVYHTNKSSGGPNQLGITAVSPSATSGAVS